MLLGLTLITFVLTYVVPGDPVDLITRSAGGPAPSAGDGRAAAGAVRPVPVAAAAGGSGALLRDEPAGHRWDCARLSADGAPALDAEAQRFHIQETINLLAGSADAHFRIVGQSTGTYPGTMALLSQSLQARESAEAAWVAEVEKLSGTGEVAGTGAPATAPTVIKELGTRGMRPEEQASQLLERALTHAVQALSAAQVASQRAIFGEEVAEKFASDEASAIMEGVVHLLESALKIVQIAIDR